MDGFPNPDCALLADPHLPLIEGVRCLLEATFESVFIVANATALRAGIQRLQPAVVVLDLAFAEGSLREVIAGLKSASSGTRLIALTTHEEPAVAEAALAAGLDGVVLKRCIARDLLSAVDAVLDRTVFVTKELTGKYVDEPGI